MISDGKSNLKAPTQPRSVGIQNTVLDVCTILHRLHCSAWPATHSVLQSAGFSKMLKISPPKLLGNQVDWEDLNRKSYESWPICLPGISSSLTVLSICLQPSPSLSSHYNCTHRSKTPGVSQFPDVEHNHAQSVTRSVPFLRV